MSYHGDDITVEYRPDAEEKDHENRFFVRVGSWSSWMGRDDLVRLRDQAERALEARSIARALWEPTGETP